MTENKTVYIREKYASGLAVDHTLNIDYPVLLE